MRRTWLVVVLLAGCAVASSAPERKANPSETVTLTREQLEQLVFKTAETYYKKGIETAKRACISLTEAPGFIESEPRL